ncbi:hypothetical protein SAMN05443575_1942 [Jatrophihabitans endophyticus]|uniref:LPXTG-motif cell wall anchor domain-containing protein n=1 Tax=Jatrophihabitans endophyticus TaxID=1206085 RepID=A0A1M5IN96_9ACTN|nr:hypothetical protein [Jatrophihabitans endophyticus]SHG29430.1 hypothetical protein SAMN05443575_1942 [Jatrophihabitans endophyticus]
MSKITRIVVALTGLALLALGLAVPSAAAPYTPGDETAAVSTTNPEPGGSLTVSASGFGANDLVTIDLHSRVYRLGTARTNANGDLSATVTLPEGVTGSHEIVMTDTVTGQVVSTAITISDSTAGSTDSGSASGGSSGSSGGTAATGVAVASIGGVGVLLFLGGALLLVMGRRRRVSA